MESSVMVAYVNYFLYYFKNLWWKNKQTSTTSFTTDTNFNQQFCLVLMSVYIKINAKVVLVGNNCCTRKLSCIINTAMITFCVVWIYVTRNIVFCIKGGITNHQLVLDSVRSNFISIPLTICTAVFIIVLVEWNFLFSSGKKCYLFGFLLHKHFSVNWNKIMIFSAMFFIFLIIDNGELVLHFPKKGHCPGGEWRDQGL